MKETDAAAVADALPILMLLLPSPPMLILMLLMLTLLQMQAHLTMHLLHIYVKVYMHLPDAPLDI